MSGFHTSFTVRTEAFVKMETLFCLFSPPSPKLSSFKLFSVSTTTPITVSSLSSPPNPKRFSSKKLHSKPTTKTPASASSTILNTNGPSVSVSVSSPPKKVLVPIGYGTEEMEAVVLVDIFRRAGAEVVVASVEPQLEIEAAGGIRLVADADISTCTDEIFDLVALPGGMPGSARLRDSESLRKITSKQAEEKRLYGAICAAPAVTLLPWGLLKRKQTTCHPAFKDMLPTFWAVSSNIQVSEELTTSRGPGTSFEFALCLVDQLFGESVAGQVGELLLINTAGNKHRNVEFNKVEWSFDNNPRALIPIANGFEEIEVVTIVDILRRANVDVVVASTEKSEQVLASQGIKIVADKLISDAAESIYDLIILPGEVAGSERLHESKVLKKLLQEQNTAERVYGAVGSSLAVLHKQGLLKGKRFTAHPSAETELMNGAINGTKVVIDGKLITSRGLATITDFALAIVSKLFGHARARSVAEGLVLEYPKSVE